MTALLKVGLMGYGFAGETFHAPVIEHCGSAEVSAIATGKPERAQADYPKATIVEDFDALLALAEGGIAEIVSAQQEMVAEAPAPRG